VLLLRTVSDESVPVVSLARSADNYTLNITVAPDAATIFGDAVDGQTILYALQNCRSADIFAGTLTSATSKVTVGGNTAPNVYLDPTVTDCNATGNCPWDFRVSNVFLNASHGGPAPTEPQLNAELHRAENVVLYVALNLDNIPSLYMRRFQRDSVEDFDTQELAEGIENLQVRFGMDTTGDGQVDSYGTADEVAAGTTGAILDQHWRSVVSVRVGMIVSSPEVAGVSALDGGGNPRKLTLLGTAVIPPDDHKMRQVYETTISLRNRIFNS
jgi:type IV pilus assembly protein PilW